MRAEAQKAGLPPTRESTWGYFVNKCANNLHIVMAMSPVGDTLKNRCRNFPGLVNNSSIDWFTAWPKQALQAVADRFLSEVNIHALYWLLIYFLFLYVRNMYSTYVCICTLYICIRYMYVHIYVHSYVVCINMYVVVFIILEWSNTRWQDHCSGGAYCVCTFISSWLQ